MERGFEAVETVAFSLRIGVGQLAWAKGATRRARRRSGWRIVGGNCAMSGGDGKVEC
jgi:hypothetical protein